MHDISKRKDPDSQQIKPSYYDEITGFANTQLFADRLRQIINLANRHNSAFSIIYLQLGSEDAEANSLKNATDIEVIKAAAHRLVDNLRSSDAAARLAEDKFALLLPETDGNAAMIVAKKLMAALATSYQANGQDLVLPVNMGISVYPQHSKEGEKLIQYAEIAMNFAKNEQFGIAVYSEYM